MRRLTYFIAVSLDGRIAGPGDEVDFYPQSEECSAWMVQEHPDAIPSHIREHAGPSGVANRHVDTVVMGRRTYDPTFAGGNVVLTYDRR